MTAWVALLRAVNVGGTGKIEMARLRKALDATALGPVKTYIASGNVVFAGPEDAGEVRGMLTDAIEGEFGGCPDILLRTREQMAAVTARNPFPDAAGNRVLVIFCEGEVIADGARHVADEEIVVDGREVFVHFPSGMGRSKLVVPAARAGTGRNMNTVAKLAAMASDFA